MGTSIESCSHRKAASCEEVRIIRYTHQTHVPLASISIVCFNSWLPTQMFLCSKFQRSLTLVFWCPFWVCPFAAAKGIFAAMGEHHVLPLFAAWLQHIDACLQRDNPVGCLEFACRWHREREGDSLSASRLRVVICFREPEMYHYVSKYHSALSRKTGVEQLTDIKKAS